MSKKKSFFERLTGSIRMDHESYDAHHDDNDDDIIEQEPESFLPEEGELAIDMYETNDMVIVQAMTAGTRKNDLDIVITRESVTIRGERHADARIHQSNYITQELYWGAFSRTLHLPEEIEVEGALAKEEHGLLTIKLPKIDKNKQAKLRVE